MAVRWTDDALDAELARRVDAQARIADALVEVERHPGHRLLAGAALTGTSAQRWGQARELLPRLWADLAVHRTAVAAACAVRTRRTRPNEREWAELRRLLVEPSVEVSRTQVALRDRGLAGAREDVRTTTLGELAEEMDTVFRELVEVVETAEAVHLAALAGLGPLAERLREARGRAAGLLAPADPDATVLTDLTAAVDARLAACANDPLAHAGRRPADLADDLDATLGAVEARLAALESVRDAWPRQREAVAAAVTTLDELWEREARARRAAQDVVADTGLTAPRDPRPALHRRLAALPGAAARPGPDALAALPVLAADVADAGQALRAAIDRAAGLTDRRGELSGRFAAYRAKAVRLGVAEEPEVRALAERVRTLLDSGPADLRALTPALVAYQRRVSAEEGSPR
jgi:hypothetical protein